MNLQDLCAQVKEAMDAFEPGLVTSVEPMGEMYDALLVWTGTTYRVLPVPLALMSLKDGNFATRVLDITAIACEANR